MHPYLTNVTAHEHARELHREARAARAAGEWAHARSPVAARVQVALGERLVALGSRMTSAAARGPTA